MKAIKLYALAVLALTSISSICITSCESFQEENPLITAETDLLGEWDMEKAFKNGRSVETVFENPQIGEVTEDWWFFKNNDVATEDGNRTLIGSWQLTDNNNSIIISISTPASKVSTYTYDILELDRLDMVWEHKLNGDLYRYEFKLSSRDTPSSVDEI